MNVRKAKAAPTGIHLPVKYCDYQQLCLPQRALNLKSLPELQSRTRQVELTAVITAQTALIYFNKTIFSRAANPE